MPGTVAAAATIRTQLYGHLAADAVLVSMIPAGANGILPQPGLSRNATPYLWIRLEGTGAIDGGLTLTTYAIEVHDNPAHGTWRLDQIVARIKWLFDETAWEPPTDTTSPARAIRSSFTGASGELADEGFGTIKRIARIQLTTI